MFGDPQKPDFLPEPFEWVFIPEGQVTFIYSPYQRVPVHSCVDAFFIAKYPITNAQYNVYLKETGSKRFCRDFLHPRVDHPIAELNEPLHPVIDVWWHEAMQFCEWLSVRMGFLITLPTDRQWQRAAQGNDQRRYPWGDEWDSECCNSLHNGIPFTTPVTQYPNGASPFGVMDMVGNAEEWCLTDAKTGENALSYEIPTLATLSLVDDARVFRGGHYQSSRASANAISVGVVSSKWYSYSCGIRVVTS